MYLLMYLLIYLPCMLYGKGPAITWPYKSTISFAMPDFENDIEN